MNVKIGRKVYDTDKSRLVAQRALSCYGDPAGFEERLYAKAKDDYFLFGQGGETSAYPQPSIVAVTVDQARDWLLAYAGEEAAAVEFAAPAVPAAKKSTAKSALKTTAKKPSKKA